MLSNPVVDAMILRKSVRTYREDPPSDEIIETIVRAGQQAPFAAQLGSVLLSRDRAKNPFRAPLLFTICADVHRLERILEVRDWDWKTNDVLTLLYGIQDAAFMAENMVIAAESLGLGSCFLGGAPYYATKIIEQYQLPSRVFPCIQLVMGYPAEEVSPRPRYPLSFQLFEDRYPEFTEEAIAEAMQVMDDGYLSQDYYRKGRAMIPLGGGRKEQFTFDDYSWTEHMGRRWGQWVPTPSALLDQIEACGFRLSREAE